MPELGAYAARSLSAASRKAREDEVYFLLAGELEVIVATSWSSYGQATLSWPLATSHINSAILATSKITISCCSHLPDSKSF
jgi:hypothetical protein